MTWSRGSKLREPHTRVRSRSKGLVRSEPTYLCGSTCTVTRIYRSHLLDGREEVCGTELIRLAPAQALVLSPLQQQRVEEAQPQHQTLPGHIRLSINLSYSGGEGTASGGFGPDFCSRFLNATTPRREAIHRTLPYLLRAMTAP